MPDHLEHVHRPLTEEERRLAAEIRAGAEKDFPPQAVPTRPIPPGIPLQIHEARTRRGLTRYQVAMAADVPSTLVRAIEEGEDVPVSQLNAVALVLGLTLELVEQAT